MSSRAVSSWNGSLCLTKHIEKLQTLQGIMNRPFPPAGAQRFSSFLGKPGNHFLTTFFLLLYLTHVPSFVVTGNGNCINILILAASRPGDLPPREERMPGASPAETGFCRMRPPLTELQESRGNPRSLGTTRGSPDSRP